MKERSLGVTQRVCVERARYFTEGFRDNLCEPMIIRRAKGLAHVLTNMSIYIEPEELLVGKQASSLRAAPMFPEFTVDWIFEEIDRLEERPADRFVLSPEEKTELLDICRWWKGRTVHDRCLATLPEEAKAAYEIGALSATGNMTSGDGHILLDFPRVLETGARGIIGDAEAELAALDPTDPKNLRKRHLLEAVIVMYTGVIDYAERYSALARKMSSEEPDPRRKAELETIARVTARVPEHPPESFHEAVQTVWFIHLISQIESNGHSMSLGRFDQYMYPYYERDLERGVITEEEAGELLCDLWLQMFAVTKIRPWNHTRFSGGGPTYQNLTLGGIDTEGNDATNALTLLCLDTVGRTRLPQPNVSVRCHGSAPSHLYRKCIEVIRLGFGMPALHNDELMIPSLLSRGVSLEDARNYAIVGCIEPIIPGKQGYRSAGMSFTIFPKIFEITLNGGADPRTGIRLLPDDRRLGNFSDFEDLMDAFARQTAYFVRVRIEGEYVIDAALEELVPEPFVTGLIDDCLRRGKTPKEGGSVYDMVTGPETGVTNVANSLAAIKRLVFDEKRLTQDELEYSLESDFAGPRGEMVRQMLLNRAPKFGNDEDEVDRIASRVYSAFIDELEKYPTARIGRGPIGCINYPCTATISANVPAGIKIGASPEGRHAGNALAEGCSPYHGTDLLGPTAVINSVAKLPTMRITGGNLLNQKINPSSLTTDEGMLKLEGLVRGFFEKKGWHIQFNTISSETLKEAQREPEKYRDLVVRVAGYSALFNNLEPATQNDIIERTEHVL
jgi:formate C-acetyltransferase